MKITGEDIVQNSTPIQVVLLVAAIVATKTGSADVGAFIAAVGVVFGFGYFYLRQQGFGEE